MDVKYSCVCRGPELLGQHASGADAGAYRALVNTICAQAKPGDLACVKLGADASYYLCPDAAYTIIAVASAQAPPRLVYAFLRLVHSRIAAGAGAPGAVDYSRILADVAQETRAESDEILQAQAELRSVKQIMTTNIDRLLERGERVGLLVDRTSQMSQSADMFNRQATHLQRKMWWQNKLGVATGALLVGGSVLLVIKLL